MPRRARLDAPGTLHHVIVRGIEKRRIVNDVADRKNFVTRLGELSVGTKTDVYAWALMTNHAHILLRSSEMGLSNFKNLSCRTKLYACYLLRNLPDIVVFEA